MENLGKPLENKNIKKYTKNEKPKKIITYKT